MAQTDSNVQGPSIILPEANAKKQKSDINLPSHSNASAVDGKSNINAVEVVAKESGAKTPADYGVTSGICQRYQGMGLQEMYDWQVECLATPGVLDDRKNIVYSAPTSGGKTLIAEILMFRNCLLKSKKAIFVVPFVSVAAEKVTSLTTLAGPSLRVTGFYGGEGEVADFEHTDIAVCTIEKCNGLLNHLIENDHHLLSTVGIVVVDEVHFISDERRGYLTELLLAKVLYALSDRVQIVAMSATLPNADVIAKWLRATKFECDFRPVHLTEYVKVGADLYDSSFNKVRKIAPLPGVNTDRDPDLLMPLVQEVRDMKGSTLIFCPSKKRTEDCAKLLAECLPKIEGLDNSSVLRDLEAVGGGGSNSVQFKAVSAGVAYYHSGLTVEERKVIEQAMRDGKVTVLTATSGLAAGVNLPARRVIFRSAMLGGAYLLPADYRQMCGRAGRAGHDALGESVLIGNVKEMAQLKHIIDSPLTAVESCLTEEKRGLTKALLEVIAAGVVKDVRNINRFLSYTFLANQVHKDQWSNATKSGLKYLIDEHFIEYMDGANTNLKATRLGSATFAAGVMSPEDALFVYGELQRARDKLLLTEDLHLLYLITPLEYNGNIDWAKFCSRYENSASMRKVATAIGLEEAFLQNAARNPPRFHLSSVDFRQKRHRRFYAAVLLYDLVCEREIEDIMAWAGASRGVLQGLQTSSATFAGCIAKFCERYGWSDFRVLMGQFIERINAGVKADLVDLVRIPYVKAARARSLHKIGLSTVDQVARCNQATLMEALKKSSKGRDDDRTLNRLARLILAGARELKSKDAMARNEKLELVQFGMKKMEFEMDDEGFSSGSELGMG